MINSSGNLANKPDRDFRLIVDVSALPEGLTPNGCLRTSVLQSSAWVIVGSASYIFARFTDLESSGINVRSTPLDRVLLTVMSARGSDQSCEAVVMGSRLL